MCLGVRVQYIMSYIFKIDCYVKNNRGDESKRIISLVHGVTWSLLNYFPVLATFKENLVIVVHFQCFFYKCGLHSML